MWIIFLFLKICSEENKKHARGLKGEKKTYSEKDPSPSSSSQKQLLYQFLFILPEVFVGAYLYLRCCVCVYVDKPSLGSSNPGGGGSGESGGFYVDNRTAWWALAAGIALGLHRPRESSAFIVV